MFRSLRSCLPVILLALGLLAPLSAQVVTTGFEENFALGDDRSKIIEKLIPGTPQWYYYRCLERQHAGALAEVPPILAAWVERHGRSGLVDRIENRQVLLSFDQDPETTWAHLIRKLDLSFDDQAELLGAKPDLPTVLDQNLISTSKLSRRAFELHVGSLDGFRPPMLPTLLGTELDVGLLRKLLDRLDRPDLPGLVAQVVRELDSERSRGFGSLGVHGRLLLDQLDDCAARRPDLLGDDRFIQTYIQRLRPDEDSDWSVDIATREAYLDRLETFSRRLGAAQNSLKAHILHHRLRHDLESGRLDRSRFMDYLRLPRRTSYVNPDYLRSLRSGEAIVDAGRAYPTGLPSIGQDEELVRTCFEIIFREEESIAPYLPFVTKRWLERRLAETRILAGLGDVERWYSLLDDPAYYESLRERVEIDFARTSRRYYAPGDPVELEVDLKNVPTLLIKTYEIDALAYYAEVGREVDATLEIEGLMASREMTESFDSSAFLRVRRRFALPELDRAGVWVVELIGNGISSRAVIRKGRLQYQERLGAAGHVFRVLDEEGKSQTDARILLAGREFRADEQGEVVIPYSTQPGRKSIVLVSGGRASLDSFEHLAERYDLAAGIHVDREALLAENKATVVVRPTLLLNDRAVSLKLLETPILTVRSVDGEGVESSLEIRDLDLGSDRDLVQEIQVPTGLRALRVELSGKIRSLSLDRDIELRSTTASFPLNMIDATDLTACPLLGRNEQGWVLDLLGLNGEAVPDRAIKFKLHHEGFSDALEVQLQTDAGGRVVLGALEGIERVAAEGLAAGYANWDLTDRARTYPGRLHAAQGETILVPYQGKAGRVTRGAFSLIEQRGGIPVRDCFDKLRLDEGRLVMSGLEPGDYQLRLFEAGIGITISVTEGRDSGEQIIGRHRMLERTPLAALDIASMAVDGDDLVLELRQATPGTRLHLVATRYLPPYDIFADLKGPDLPSAGWSALPTLDSIYESGRRIADEYRYILERRFAKKFPGNMLDRPGLLLNPWAMSDTNSAIGLGGGAGGQYGGRGGGRRRSRRGAGGHAGPSGPQPGVFASLEFLPEGSRLLANLVPDDQGRVRVALADLGAGQVIHALAIDHRDAVYRNLVRTEKKLEPRDRRLARPLDPQAHLAERREIEFVDAGKTTRVEDRMTSRLKVYDDLGSVFRLFQTMAQGGELARFAFILDWPTLDDERKNELYSEHACHELHFFLKEKDPTYFEAVVRPYLANKLDKTFLDDYLLGADLSAYLRPWAFERLNIVERVLLTRAIEGQTAGGARHLRELFELTPPDQERLALFFATALAGDALAGDENSLELKSRDASKGLAPAESGRPGAPPPARKADLRANAEPVEDAADADEMEELEDEKAKSDDFVADKPMDRAREQMNKLEELQREVSEKDVQARKKQVSHYRAPSATQRFIERNYWGRSPSQSGAEMIAVNEFWVDFARTPEGVPFRSKHFVQASSNFSEMMFALALLDLPFKAAEHELKIEGKRLDLTPGSPLLIMREELREARPADEPSQVLVSQAFFRADDPYLYVSNERRDKYVSKEFLVGVTYGCRVVLTNPTSSPRKLELLVQIPQGAIPVRNGVETRGVPVRLESYGTTTHEFYFYFPSPGDFAHYPVHASREGSLVASAQPASMKVVRELSEIDTGSWDYLSQNGSADQVIAHLEATNVRRLDLGRMAWRLRDRNFFTRATALLAARHRYDHKVWSYGLYHRDPAAARQYLEHADGFLDACGPYLESPLVRIDPVERLAYQQVDYSPLFNPRAHPMGSRREILNGDIAGQFARLMDILGHRARLDDDDWMSVTCYLLLQDRIEEALAAFARIDPARLETRIQFDYMHAYLDFFTTEHALARGIAEPYRDHPVERWRKLFRNVLQQLDEADGKAVAVIDEDDRDQNQTAAAAQERSLEVSVEARKIEIDYRNLTSCEIGFYEMDIEFLFSSSPFVQEGSDATAFIRPNRSMKVELPERGRKTTIDLPEEYRNSNLIVEVRAGGLRRRQTYFANSLSLQMIENFGQLRVTDAQSGKGLPRVYIKVFARDPGGNVRFHKDGYTDLRGRFDYVSLSGPEGNQAERYAVLILSEDRGAMIREADAPVQ